MATKSGIILIKEFFGTKEKPVGMDELKALSLAERNELAGAIAAQCGYKKVENNGQVSYEVP